MVPSEAHGLDEPIDLFPVTSCFAAAVVLYMEGNAIRLEHVGSPFFRYAAFEAVPRERVLEVSPPREC